jgi:dimethylaniline monooxygenase (N-oxide forming)
MAQRKRVCVIGAGVSGLVTAKVFKARGHDVTIIERGPDLGGVWELSRSYPDVQTQSPKDLYRYTDKAMPEAYPEWPKGPQVHAYLSAYADDHALRPLIRFGVTVEAMERGEGATGWTLSLRGEGGRHASGIL